MQYGTKTSKIVKARTQCIVVGVYANNELTESARQLDVESEGYLRKILKRGGMTGKIKELTILHDLPNISAPRTLLVGLGDRKTLSASRFVTIARAVGARLKTLGVKHALCCLQEIDCQGRGTDWKITRLIEHLSGGMYEYTAMKGKQKKRGTEIGEIDFATTRAESESLDVIIKKAEALLLGLTTAKDLANTPANICTPTYLAGQATKLARKYASLSVEVLEEAELEQLGMGAFMSVTQGSDEPGKLIIIMHQGGDEDAAPHLILGKGITFDSGGISLKPGGGMADMIFDMCGAASVIGTMAAVAKQRLPVNVVGVVAAAENMPSGGASRPGDIVTTLSGQTVEILNTDAEGRLVLCDALTYIKRFKPATVVDIATLTGACIVALGAHASALYANDEGLADDLIKAGEDSRDRVWRMPLWDDYQAQLDSAFADIANIGGSGAGSITAACFLSRFAGQYRWAHLDVAGTAFKGGGPGKGATGRPVTLLWEYLNIQAG